MRVEPADPLISLKTAGRLLGMDLNAVRRLAKKKKGVRLQTVKVSPRRLATTVSWVETYLAQLNPPAAELISATPCQVGRVDSRKAAQIDKRLAAKGYCGANKKREVLGVPQVRRSARPLP